MNRNGKNLYLKWVSSLNIKEFEIELDFTFYLYIYIIRKHKSRLNEFYFFNINNIHNNNIHF